MKATELITALLEEVVVAISPSEFDGEPLGTLALLVYTLAMQFRDTGIRLPEILTRPGQHPPQPVPRRAFQPAKRCHGSYDHQRKIPE